MAADKIVFDYSAMERRSGDTIRAEDWNAAMRAIAELVAAVNAVAGTATSPLPAPVPATAPPAGAGTDWTRSFPLDPAPARVGTITIGQGLRAVAIDTEYAYVSCQHSFRVFYRSRYDQSQTFSDPANSLYLSHFAPPAPLGQAPCPDAEDIFLAGGYTYIAAGQDGLAIVNVGDPRQPRVESILPLSGAVIRVCVVGNVAYVVSYENGLQIVDVADKQKPALMGQIFVIMPNGIVVRDNCAYISSDDDGYCIVDVSNPVAPAYLYQHGAREFSMGKDLCLYGDLAYIGDGILQSLITVDISQRTAPHVTNTLPVDISGTPVRMVVRGTALLVATGFLSGRGLCVYDISNGGVPVLVASVGSPARGMAADDRYVYLTTDAGVLEVYDLRPPKLTLPAGSVGIGTADPQARLEVKGGRTLLEQEAWQKLETERPDGDDYVAYFKDSLGIVHLRGTLKSTVAAGGVKIGVLFSLPAGYRPEPGSSELHLVTARGLDGAGTWACVMLYPEGPVELQTGERAALILDGITFRAAR